MFVRPTQPNRGVHLGWEIFFLAGAEQSFIIGYS
jgi:hypothetical protein